MSILKAVVLGVVQGITEFLPVSSSGHLVIFQEFLRSEQGFVFDVFVHFGTLIAILIVFRRDIVEILMTKRWVIFFIAVGSVPIFVVGATLKPYIAKTFVSLDFVGYFLVVNGIVLILATRRDRRRIRKQPIGFGRAIGVGVAQAFGLLPGISRSGSTISVGLMAGLSRRDAVRFSFLLAIPAIVGAVGYDFIRYGGTLVKGEMVLPIVVGTIVAAVIGYVALRILLGIVNRGKLWFFSFYCFIVGIFIIIVRFFR